MPDYARETGPPLSARDADLWREAQAAEFRAGNTADAVQKYRRLLTGSPLVVSRVQLALLRLALERADTSDATFWLKALQTSDPTAATESGIPTPVAASLLLIGRGNSTLPSEAAELSNQVLSRLLAGRWLLNAAQWIYYAREISSAPGTDPRVRAEVLATAGFQESLAAEAGDLLALNEGIESRRDRPFVSRYFPAIKSAVVLFPGEGRSTGLVLPGDQIGREAQARLTALTAWARSRNCLACSTTLVWSAARFRCSPDPRRGCRARWRSRGRTVRAGSR